MAIALDLAMAVLMDCLSGCSGEIADFALVRLGSETCCTLPVVTEVAVEAGPPDRVFCVAGCEPPFPREGACNYFGRAGELLFTSTSPSPSSISWENGDAGSSATSDAN